MANPGMVVKMDGESSKLNNELGKAAKKTEEVEDALEGVTKESKKADAQLRKFAKRMTELNATPQEKMARKQKMLNAALRKGLITQQTYNRELAQMQRHAAKMKGGMFSGLGKFAPGLAAGGAAGAAMAGVDMAKQLGQFMIERGAAVRSSALEEFRGRDIGLKELVQVSEGSTAAAKSADFRKLRDRRDQMALAGVNLEDAARVVFDARSQGFEDALPVLTRFSQVGDIGVGSLLAGKTRNLFKGKDKIAPEEILNMALVAAKASELDIGQLGGVMPRAVEGLSQTGASASESLAVTSVLAGQFKSGDSAADRIKAFASKQALDKELQGMGIVAAVENLAAGPEDRRRQFLGESIELNAAYTAIKAEADLIKQRTTQIKAARKNAFNKDSELQMAFAVAETDSDMMARKQLKISENRKSEALATRGARASMGKVAENVAVSELAKSDMSDIAVGVGEYAAGTIATLGGQPADVREGGLFAGGATQGMMGGVMSPSNWLFGGGVGVGMRAGAGGAAAVNGVNDDTAKQLNQAAKNLNNATKSSALKRLGSGAEEDAKRMQNGANQ